MQEREYGLEDGLEEERAYWNTAALPSALDEAVLRGMQQTRRNNRRRMRRASAGVSLMLLCAVLLGMVRVSPAFAAVVAGLPGLSGIVSLVAGDKGLEGAVRSDFVQPMNVSDSHDGITFTVNGIIVDETRLNVFYTLKLPVATTLVPKDAPVLYDADTGKRLFVSTRYFNSGPTERPKAEFQDRLDASFSMGDLPDRVRLSFKLMNEDKDWSVVLPIDKARFAGMKEVIPVGQTVTIQGQHMLIQQATIHPTSITVDVNFDKNNSMRLFWLNNMQIVTDTGEKLVNQGAEGMNPDGMTLRFESDFFSKPKHLTLKGSRMMALDKSKLELKLDLEQKRIVQAPDDAVRLVDVVKTGEGVYTVTLGVKTNFDRDHYLFTIVDGEFSDARGTKFQMVGSHTLSVSGDQEVMTTFEAKLDKPYENPLTFSISNYPSWIEQPFEVKLK